jgi:hypothetical protein
MILLPDEILKRQPKQDYAFLAKDRLVIQATGAESVAGSFNDTEMSELCVISTDDLDRVGDVVDSLGGDWEGFSRAPCVYCNHQHIFYPLPIAFAWDINLPLDDPERKCTIKADVHKITAKEYYSRSTSEGAIFYALAKEGMRGKSIGFNPKTDPQRLPTGGFRYPNWYGLEFSNVGVAANPNATSGVKAFSEHLRSMLDKGRIGDERIPEQVFKFLTPMAAARHGAFLFTGDAKPMTKSIVLAQPKPDPIRWNKSFPTEFDVALEPSRPMNVMYEWVARHIGVEIKHLFQNGTSVPAAKMGSFLTGLKSILSQHEKPEVRNIQSSDGREVPPVYRAIQLNSTQRDDFLIDGLAFYRGQVKFAVLFEPTWFGEAITVFTKDTDAAFNNQILDKAAEWAKRNNFLKGEAFALSGEFLPRTTESWDDIFLEEVNRKSLQRNTELLNKKQEAFASRGSILTGPPGTGKTMSAKILRNVANATFIWVSARDFHYAGSSGGVSLAFDMAKELAPSVLVMEDIDNWLYDTTIDLIKSEMDGVLKSTAVWTLLTTNFPERLPEALIDRPGRFHDVLHFAQPTKEVRQAMLAKWLPGVPEGERIQAAARTEGMSGAHVYELAAFAKMLSEQDGMEPTQALREAIRKVEEQRDLITAIQLEGSHYKPQHRVRERTFKPGIVKSADKYGFVQVELKEPQKPDAHGFVSAKFLTPSVKSGMQPTTKPLAVTADRFGFRRA